MDLHEIAFVLGRALLGGYFLFNGIMHFIQLDMLAGYAAGKGVPYPRLAVAGASLLIVIGGLGVLLGAYVTWALYALIVFMIPVTFTMHAFWKVEEPNERTVSRIQFLKNMALLGAIMMLLLVPTPWPLALLQIVF